MTNSAYEWFSGPFRLQTIIGSMVFYECSICFAMVREQSVPEHFSWHGVA